MFFISKCKLLPPASDSLAMGVRRLRRPGHHNILKPMDHSPIRQNFDLGKINKIYHHSYFFFIYLTFATRAGTPQQREPITVGPCHLTHPVYFPCGRKPECSEETHDSRQSVDFYSFRMRTGFESHSEILPESRTRYLRGERRVV